MSVFISVLKVKDFLGKECNGGVKHATYIYSLDFYPIMHLTKFEEGYYKTERLEKSVTLDLSYTTYNRFRLAICNMVHHVTPSVIWTLIKLMKGKPFVELINFGDNEGCFDYIVAEKLYNDFVTYRDRAEKDIPEFYDCYCTYMKILENAVKCKGIVQYS